MGVAKEKLFRALRAHCQSLHTQIPGYTPVYVTEAFTLYSDIARFLPPSHRSCTDSEENSIILSQLSQPYSGAEYVVQYS